MNDWAFVAFVAVLMSPVIIMVWRDQWADEKERGLALMRASKPIFKGDHAIGRCEARFDALEWATDLIQNSSLVMDPAVCERLEECDRLLGRDQ